MTTVTETDIARALGTDYLLLRSELTEQETDYLERTRRFVVGRDVTGVSAFASQHMQTITASHKERI